MSSPFQKKFMAKNPVKGFTLDQLKKASDKSQKEMVKNAETLNKQNPEAGGQNYEKKEEFDFPGADGYETKEDSPLNAYVSTAGHFQRLQDNIARAFTPIEGILPDKGAKGAKANKEYLEAEEQAAASKVITGDGFGNRSGGKPIEIEDIDVYDESDLEFDNQ